MSSPQQAAMHSGQTAQGGWKTWYACTLEPELLARMALSGNCALNEVKLIPRISSLTLLELHGKSICHIKYAEYLESEPKTEKYLSNKCASFVCSCFRVLKLPWRALPGLYLPTLYQELLCCKETSPQQFVCIMEGDSLTFYLSCAPVSPFGHRTWLRVGCSCGEAEREGVDVSSAALSLHDSKHKLMK